MIRRSSVRGWRGIAAASILCACSSKTATAPDGVKTADAGLPAAANDGGDAEPPVALRDAGGGAADSAVPADLDPNLGLTWTAVPTGTDVSLNDVVWTGTRLYAVGAGGTVLSSNDGSSWTKVASGLNVDLTQVIWTGSRLVARDSNDEILTSDTGTSWTVRFSRPKLNVAVLGKVGSKIVAVAGDGLALSLVSSDGITWAIHEQPDFSIVNFSSCASGSSSLVCVGWNNAFAASQCEAFVTSDGVSWTDISPSFTCDPFTAVAWKNDDIVATGSSGSVSLRTAGRWIFKPRWDDDERAAPAAGAVIWTDLRAVAVGDGLVITSEDAHPYNWRRGSGAHGQAMAFTGRRLVAVGADGSSFISPAPNSSRDAGPPDSSSSVLDGGGAADGSTDAKPDAACTVASGDPCSTAGETCSRGASCCVCEMDEASPSKLHWTCVEPLKAGVCSSLSSAPTVNSSCAPATMVCPFCVAGAPQCFRCAVDPLVTGRYFWTKRSNIGTCE